MAVWSITNVKEINKSHRIDSEYFQPFYLEAEEKVLTAQNKKLGQIGQFLIGPFGSAFHVSNYDSTSPYRYIRGKDVKPFSLLDEDSVFMPEKDFKRLEKYAVMPEDLLISVVGTLGNVAIVPSNVKGIFSCKSTVFRNSTVDPFYLLAYFNSTYGRNCLLRRQRGAIQTGLNKDDLKTIPIPIFEDEIAIGSLVRESLCKQNESTQLYTQAQKLLEGELGFNNLILKKQKHYKSSFSEIVRSKRFDSEFFDTKYDLALDIVKNYQNGFCLLKQISKKIEPNFKPDKLIKSYDYLEIGDVNISNGEYVVNRILTDKLPANAKIKLTGDELLISQVRPTRGAICLIDNLHSNILVCSGAFYVCRLHDNSQNEVVFLYLRIMKNIFEKYCGGTSYPTVDSHYLSKFPIPNITDNLSQLISELIKKAKVASKESAQLLEQAKKRVEELIERGARA